MKPQVTFGDAERLGKTILVAAFEPRPESYKPATISPDFPTAKLTTATHVQVELDGSSTADYPVTERDLVRVTCYAGPGKRDNVKALASLTMALLYSYPGDAAVAGVTIPGGRSAVIKDPDTGNLMVWFLARLSLTPATLATP